MLIKELMADKGQSGKKYEIEVSDRAPVYNNPSFLDLKETESNDVTFKGSQLKDLDDEAKEYFANNSKELAKLGIAVVDSKVTEAWLGVSEFISTVSQEAADMDDEGEEIETFQDAMGAGVGSQLMPYGVTFIVTLAPGQELNQKAADKLGDLVTGAIWGQYNTDGDIEAEFHEVK